MSSVSSVPPFVEALTMPSTHGDRPWDGILAATTEVANRRKLRQDLDQAVHIDPIEERYDLYRSLNDLLATGINDRFVLYCPLYLVPDVDWYRQYDESVDSFSELFITSWYRMLYEHDVRANFIDGDVPDIELGIESLEMVVQAAYLAPYLEAKGLISRSQLPGDDPVLLRSLAHAFGQESKEPIQTTGWTGSTSLAHHVSVELRDHYQYGGVSEKRAKWLRWDRRRKSINHLGRILGQRLADGLTIQELGQLDTDSSEVVAIAIGSAIEQSWLVGMNHCKIDEMYQRLWPTLVKFFENDELRDAVTSVFCRLFSIGCARKKTLDELGIFYPTLEGPFLRNLSPIRSELTKVGEGLQDPELLKIIYPAAVVFGSNLKGYGGLDADIDLAVFARPDSTITDYVRLGKLLKDKLGHNTVEYWLEEDGPNLRVHDFDDLAADIGDSSNAHVLLGGAWEGELSTISMLGERLLKPYLCERNEAVREVWLREMERDLLQYRLLHRGYERFNVPRTDVFLDDGYRMMASQLYASHVFIPHID